MTTIVCKIKSAEVADVHEHSPFEGHRFKGILMEVECIKKPKKTMDSQKIWLNRRLASELSIIPKNYGHLTDAEINNYIKEKSLNKKLYLKQKLFEVL